MSKVITWCDYCNNEIETDEENAYQTNIVCRDCVRNWGYDV